VTSIEMSQLWYL